MPLKVVIRKKETGVFQVALYGPLDTQTYPVFEKEVGLIAGSATKAIYLNMEGVNYISSMGIGSVFKLANSTKANGGTLLITNLQPQIKKVFETVKALPDAIFSSVEEADEYLNEIQKKALRKDEPPL